MTMSALSERWETFLHITIGSKCSSVTWLDRWKGELW